MLKYKPRRPHLFLQLFTRCPSNLTQHAITRKFWNHHLFDSSWRSQRIFRTPQSKPYTQCAFLSFSLQQLFRSRQFFRFLNSLSCILRTQWLLRTFFRSVRCLTDFNQKRNVLAEVSPYIVDCFLCYTILLHFTKSYNDVNQVMLYDTQSHFEEICAIAYHGHPYLHPGFTCR